MAKSTPELKKRIESVIQQAMDVYNPENFTKSLEILMEGWNSLEDPKSEWSQSYDLAKYITIVHYNSDNIDNIKTWIPIFLECERSVMNYGESEMWAGKFAFEQREFDKAKEYFAQADEKSKGRLWAGESDPKYFMFFKEK